MQCACAILSSVRCPALQYFCTLSHKRQLYIYTYIYIYIELPNTKFVFWFSLKICAKYFSFKEEMSEIWLKLYIGIHVKYRYYCPILMKLGFCRPIFEKILKYKISWKSVQWEPSCSKRTDGRTDMMELIIAFRNFANASGKSEIISAYNIKG